MFLSKSTNNTAANVVRTAVVAFALALAIAVNSVGSAMADQAVTVATKPQAPGFYRLTLGAFEITALSDGVLPLPATQLLKGATSSEIKQLLALEYLTDLVPTSANAFLVDTGAKLVLVDTGAGRLLGPAMGQLLANLRAAGYKPEQIDEIYITHMHVDHTGGLSADGQPLFPHAIVRASKAEADYWLNPQTMSAAPKEAQRSFQQAIDSLKPYEEAGKLQTFAGDTELVPGIRATLTAGHTPGHVTYVVASQGQTLLIWGDLMHVGAVQFARPGVTIQFDSDATTAVAQRRKALREAAQGGYWVAGAHLPFPGLGHVRAEAPSYQWIPTQYGVSYSPPEAR
jgi:glyoxylase-like metal-dependent hydrolase (beta-lactamase superfamily II)